MQVKLYDRNGVRIAVVEVQADEYMDACDQAWSLADEYPDMVDFDLVDFYLPEDVMAA